MNYKILKLAFAVWIILWLWFMARGLFIRNYFYDYKTLLARDLEGKRSYVTGDRLYEFLTFCRRELPPGSSFRLVGVKEDSIDRRRAAYYLYPLIEKNEAEFLLVYDSPDMEQAGYAPVAELDRKRYILGKGRKR